MLRQRCTEATPLRVPLPANAAYSFIERAELIVFAPIPEYQYDFRALMASVVNLMFVARGLTGVSCRVRDVHVDDYNITLQAYCEEGRAGRRGPDDLRVMLLLVSEHPRIAHLLTHFIDHVQSNPLGYVALAETNLSAVIPSGWASNYDVVLDYIDPNVIPYFDELLPYVPAANQDFTPYLLQVADVDKDVAVDAGVAAKVSTSDGVGRLSSEPLELCEATFRSLTAQTLKSYAGRLSQFAEFYHDSEIISPLEATTATVVRLRKGAASAANAMGVPLSHIRYQGGWATNSDVVLDYIDPNVLPSPGAWFFFGHIAPLRHFQVQPDSAAVAFPVPPS
eukprot:jgi/Tetstr1/466056/TSEL_010643.t1